MLIMNVFLILLYCISLSFQTIKSWLFCDDRITDIYVYDESLRDYRHLQTLNNPEDCYNVDYVDLDVDPGALIKFSCRNDAAETLGGGCFLINNNCSCYDFNSTKGFVHSNSGRTFKINCTNGKIYSHYARFLLNGGGQYYDYQHYVPLDVNEITCNPKTIFAPIKKKLPIKFSEFIEYQYKVTNLKISVNKNFQIFTLDNKPLSPNTKFNILKDLEYSHNQISNINIQFINYGVEIENNIKTCELNISFLKDENNIIFIIFIILLIFLIIIIAIFYFIASRKKYKGEILNTKEKIDINHSDFIGVFI